MNNLPQYPSVAVVGIGAVGGTVAAALGDGGHSPLLVARQPLTTISRSLAGKITEYQFRCVTDPSEAGKVDWVLLCTKAYQVDDATQWLERLVGDTTTVAILQNGVDHVERLSPFVPTDQLLPVVVYMACERERSGFVSQIRAGHLHVPDSARGRLFATLFEPSSAIEVVPETDFVSLLWRKLAINATTGAICTLTLNPNNVVSEQGIRGTARALMDEVMTVGRAEGASFPRHFVDETLDMLGGPVGRHWTSMAQDRKAGRRTEWEVRNAVIGKIARRYGIPTPLNDLVSALLSVAT